MLAGSSAVIAAVGQRGSAAHGMHGGNHAGPAAPEHQSPHMRARGNMISVGEVDSTSNNFDPAAMLRLGAGRDVTPIRWPDAAHVRDGSQGPGLRSRPVWHSALGA